MNTLLTGAIIVLIAAWFGYSLYRMFQSSQGKNCASCALGSSFDYKKHNMTKLSQTKRTEYVTSSGHHIIVDEEAARKRRERIRKMMESHQK